MKQLLTPLAWSWVFFSSSSQIGQHNPTSLLVQSFILPPPATLHLKRVKFQHGLVKAHLTSSLAFSTALASSSTSTTAPGRNVMGGVQECEQWFKNSQDVNSDTIKVRHASFQGGTLRGLELLDNVDVQKPKTVVSIPRKLCLATAYTKSSGGIKESWDVQLAWKLLQECQLGSESALYGYTSLLKLGTTKSNQSTPPPSTAPDTIRHWTPAQREILLQSASESAKRLLQKADNQLARWKEAYAATKDAHPTLQPYGEAWFIWAMEAVHSRAFRGNFGPLVSSNNEFSLFGGVRGIAVQIVGAALGWAALVNDVAYSNIIAIVCALVVMLPLVMQASGDNSGGQSGATVALLPIIDSANHDGNADSDIVYDPLTDCISLKVGPKCLAEEGQLCVSYGENKSDAEWLINYGFLAGADIKHDCVKNQEQLRDGVRRQLAQEYARRCGQ